MASDFSTIGRAARALISVPEVPINEIRARSYKAAARERVRNVVGGAMCLVVLGAGVTVGAKLYNGARVWLYGGEAAVTVRSMVMVRQPMASDLRALNAHTTFPIVFPVGLPAGTRVSMIMFAPAERPSSVTLEYRNDRTNFHAGISLFDSATVNANDATLPTGAERPPFRAAYHWQVGKEIVLVPKTSISTHDAERIEAAMRRVSPASSLASTDSMLRKVTVLGGSSELADVAERYAQATSSSVLLDEHVVRDIPRLVKQGKPVLDTRTVFLSNIPSVHGEPDFSKATLNWPKVVVVPVVGVRAIDAVLRSTKVRGTCGCEILFSQPDDETYWIWKIPPSGLAATKYVVDAKTLTPSEHK
jgi:hypothetical protein